MAAAAIIVAFHSLAFVVEAPLLAWSERLRARWFSSAALLAVSLSSLFAALFPSGIVLFVALAIYGPASGCANAVAEGLLVEAKPAERERTMTRISLAAAGGDLAVPVLLAILAALGLGFRAGFVVAGVVALLLALAHASSRSLDRVVSSDHHRAEGEDELDQDAPERTSIGQTLRLALSNRPLLAWSFANVLTSLLDEVLVAFSAVHLDAIGASSSERSWAIGSWVVGGFCGLLLLERSVWRFDPRRVLLLACGVTTASLSIVSLATSPRIATVALFSLGASSALLHPLVKARAYACLPGRPALVNAISSMLLPLDMAAPIVLGAIAVAATDPASPARGSMAALLALLIAPVGVALVAFRVRAASYSA